MRRIPSLDGLRALSILLVLAQHSLMGGAFHQRYPFLGKVLGNGQLGVSIFFVISGFLITSLLLKEDGAGQISLKRFFIRRAFRILPPYYVFLFVLLLLQQTGFLDNGLRGWTDASAFLIRWQAAFVFLRDYIGHGDWWTDHTWSISIEEKFYLLWPVCLALAGLAKSKKIALAAILASPVIRLTCHVLWPIGMERELIMFHMRMDGVMSGCALALFYEHLQFKWRWRWTLSAAIFLFVVSPYLLMRFHGYYELLFGLSLDNLAIAYLVLYVVRNPNGAVGRILNHRVIAHIGVVSYSLYLWQELFLGKFQFPWGVLGAFLAAELSWRIVERPMLKLRDRMMERRELASCV